MFPTRAIKKKLVIFIGTLELWLVMSSLLLQPLSGVVSQIATGRYRDPLKLEYRMLPVWDTIVGGAAILLALLLVEHVGRHHDPHNSKFMRAGISLVFAGAAVASLGLSFYYLATPGSSYNGYIDFIYSPTDLVWVTIAKLTLPIVLFVVIASITFIVTSHIWQSDGGRIVLPAGHTQKHLAIVFVILSAFAVHYSFHSSLYINLQRNSQYEIYTILISLLILLVMGVLFALLLVFIETLRAWLLTPGNLPKKLTLLGATISSLFLGPLLFQMLNYLFR